MTLSDLDINADSLFASESEKADIIQCIRTLLLTPEGTIPLYRGFGINQQFLGTSIDVAGNLLAVEIMDKVATYEPRAAVTEVRIEPEARTGKLKVKVVIANG